MLVPRIEIEEVIGRSEQGLTCDAMRTVLARFNDDSFWRES